jgi:hypothetical protein
MCITSPDVYESLPKLHPERVIETIRVFMAADWAALNHLSTLFYDLMCTALAESVLSLSRPPANAGDFLLLFSFHASRLLLVPVITFLLMERLVTCLLSICCKRRKSYPRGRRPEGLRSEPGK